MCVCFTVQVIVEFHWFDTQSLHQVSLVPLNRPKIVANSSTTRSVRIVRHLNMISFYRLFVVVLRPSNFYGHIRIDTDL